MNADRNRDTSRPPAFEMTPKGCRDLAQTMRRYASEWLSRAAALDEAADRYEGEDES